MESIDPVPPESRAAVMDCWVGRSCVLAAWLLLSPTTAPGPARAAGPVEKGGDKGRLAGIKVPPGFEVTLFAAPPEVRYPTCLAATPDGEVFVGVDENGSLDRKPDRGRVLRCVDGDGDGRADRITVFARMESPRGLVHDGRTLFVLHPPDLTAYHDDDGDGQADRSETLVRGIGRDLSFRGADHTTNGIRLGIDGWLYIAVGDYGFVKAVGEDGAERQLRGGGVARVRTDGSGLEVVSRGQRNIYDVAIDPYLNLFTRDNTNDGGGWDVRLSHVVPTGHYGYPLLFTHFGEEIVQPLADYGGGSPTGALYIQEPSLPAGFNEALYTCDWGRGAIYRHPLTPEGAGFKAGQEVFVTIPRPTDMDIDARGRIYVSTWRNGGFTHSGPDVGEVVRITYPGITPPLPPDLDAADEGRLLDALAAPGATLRLHAQRTLLRRGETPTLRRALEARAMDGRATPAARVAAVFTLEQLLGRRSHEPLARLAKDPALREPALRALADRTGEASEVPTGPFVAALSDPDPRVRLQAVVALGRLGKSESAPALVPLLADPDPLVAHVAVQALVALRAIGPCLAALDPSTPQLIPGAVRVLQSFHDPRLVETLIARLSETGDANLRKGILKALCRLYRREAPWDGAWWGTRPDTSGPYFKPEPWEKSVAIRQVLGDHLHRSDDATLRWLLPELIRNRIDFDEATALALKLAVADPLMRDLTVDLLGGRPNLPPEAIRFLGAVAADDQDPPGLRARALDGLRRIEGANADAALDAALRALGEIGLRDDPPADLQIAWRDFVHHKQNRRFARNFLAAAEAGDPGPSTLAYAALIELAGGEKPPGAINRAIEQAWGRPEVAARLLRAIGLNRAERYIAQVQARLQADDPRVRRAAADAAHRLGLDRAQARQGPAIAALDFDQVVAGVRREQGDPELGALLFQKQGCTSCHTISRTEPLKGPYLGDIANRYDRAELAESILRPSARLAQGFETLKIATTSGQVFEGFIVRESGAEVELRNASGDVTVIPKAEIEERGSSDVSIMPVGLADPLTVPELASILAYLEFLKNKS
jgi:putative heme-binding domain-containing protein